MNSATLLYEDLEIWFHPSCVVQEKAVCCQAVF